MNTFTSVFDHRLFFDELFCLRVISSHPMTRRDSIQPLCEKRNLQSLHRLPLENPRDRKSGTSFLCLWGKWRFSFQQLVSPHLKMVWLFPPEITLTLPMKTDCEAKGAEHVIGRKTYFVIYIAIWANLEVFLWY